MEENKGSQKDKRKEQIQKYKTRQEVILRKYPKIFDESTPLSIKEEYMVLNSLIDSMRASDRKIHGEITSSDGYVIDKFVQEKYENALGKLSDAKKKNEKYITPEEEQRIEAEMIAKENREQQVEEYIRRQGVILKKYPKIFDESTPLSIKEEYTALNSLIDSMRASDRKIHGEITSSDGYVIDKFVQEKYENALGKLSDAKKQNEEYITPEEEANFEFPEINDIEIITEMRNIKSINDFYALKDKLNEFSQNPLPKETRKKLEEWTKEVYSIGYNLMKKRDRQGAEGKVGTEKVRTEKIGSKSKVKDNSRKETIALVDESKFESIYGKAKRKIKEAFSKIKDFAKEKFQGKNNKDIDNQDIDRD